MDTPASQPVRAALVVEDLDDVRQGLVDLVREAFAAVEVTQARDLRSARAVLRGRAAPDHALLALIDLGLPDGSGLDLIAELRVGRPGVRVVVTTVFDDDLHLMRAIAAGAHGYLLKDRDRTDLVAKLRGLEQGDTAITPAVARRLLEQLRTPARAVAESLEPPSGPTLTTRETEVLQLIGRGLTVPEAAGVLTCSAQTVATHVKTIYRKLGIASRAEAALEASRRKLA